MNARRPHHYECEHQLPSTGAAGTHTGALWFGYSISSVA